MDICNRKLLLANVGEVSFRCYGFRNTRIFTRNFRQSRIKGIASLRLKLRRHRPVLHRQKFCDIRFSFADQAERNRLDPARRQAVVHRLPDERRDLISNDPVHRTACTLRIHKMLIDLQRIRHCLRDTGGSDLMKENAVDIVVLCFDFLCNIKGDGFAFTVRIRCDEHFV